MSQLKTQIFLLVGVHAGATLNLNGHEFVDGRLEVNATPQVITGLTNLFSYYSAVPEEEYDSAHAEYERAVAEAAAKAAGQPAPAPAPVTDLGSADRTPQAVVEDKPTLAEAIGLLDPEDDAHWTSNNLPAIDVLEQLTGAKVSRADVNAVAEDFTRAKARAAKAMA